MNTKKFTNSIVAILCLFLSISMEAQELTNTEIEITELIAGTLTSPIIPTQKLAIIIAGSGPTDRNGNSQLTRNNSLKLLAEELSKNGIATYRYDKRTVAMMKKRVGKIKELRFEDFIDDAAAVISYFKSEGTYQEISVIGHNQGSLIGMVAGEREKVSGIISLAGPSQSIDQSIIEQVTMQMPNFEQELRDNFDTLRKTGNLTEYNPLLESIFNRETQPFILSWMDYDPSEEVKKVTCPLLIINGTRDLQVSVQDAERLLVANPKAAMTIVKNMNHVLRNIDTEDTMINQKSYQEPNTPISEELVAIISSFIKELE